MHLFSSTWLRELASSAPESPCAWRRALGAAERGAQRVHRVESAWGCLPSEVREPLRGWLLEEDPIVAQRGWGALCALAIAGQAGSVVEGWGEEADAVRLRGPTGEVWWLGVESFVWPVDDGGCVEDVARLESALDQLTGLWRLFVTLKRPLPRGYDPDALVRAVDQWQHAVARGETPIRHAVYEDDEVSLEFELTDMLRGEEGGALLFLARPLRAESRLREAMSAVAGRLKRKAHEEALVIALSATQRWRIPRGHAQTALYGPLVSTVALQADAPEFCSTHQPRSALLAQGAAERLAALWWLEDEPSTPLGFRGWSTRNPWRAVAAPAFPGRRYERVAGGAQDENKPVEMCWRDRSRTVWRPLE